MMREIFELILNNILEIGGLGVLLFAVASWLGKIWASKILEKEKQKYSMEIESYKSRLEIELAKANSVNQKALFETKIQYKKEFSIYLELWENLTECVQHSLALYPFIEDVPNSEDELEEFNIKKYDLFVISYNKYSKTINKYSPFYKYGFDEYLKKIKIDCNSLGDIFKQYKFDVKSSDSFASVRDMTMSHEERKKVYVDLPESIKQNMNKLKDEIIMYFQKLKDEISMYLQKPKDEIIFLGVYWLSHSKILEMKKIPVGDSAITNGLTRNEENISTLLLDIANGKIDPIQLAKNSIANRGLGKNGEWVGFDNSKEIWNSK